MGRNEGKRNRWRRGDPKVATKNKLKYAIHLIVKQSQVVEFK